MEEWCYFQTGFEVLFVQDSLSDTQIIPYCLEDVGLSTTSPAQCLPAGSHAHHHDDNGLNL